MWMSCIFVTKDQYKMNSIYQWLSPMLLSNFTLFPFELHEISECYLEEKSYCRQMCRVDKWTQFTTRKVVFVFVLCCIVSIMKVDIFTQWTHAGMWVCAFCVFEGIVQPLQGHCRWRAGMQLGYLLKHRVQESNNHSKPMFWIFEHL